MGDHNASCMLPAGSHNSVPDLDESVRRFGERGGKERVTGRIAGMGRLCIVEDPAGRALYQPE
jgi:predicted enzyme related to lactoylglutathione lyase